MVLKANPWPALFNRNSYTTFWSWKSNNKVTETQFKCISNNWNTMQVQGSLFQFLRLSDKLWKYVSLRSITYLLTYSSSFPLAHRSSTRTPHLTPFCAVLFVSFHVRCFLSISEFSYVARCAGVSLSFAYQSQTMSWHSIARSLHTLLATAI